MADEDQKTEAPSGKRLGEAQAKGQVVESQEVGHWFALFAGTVVVVMFGASLARRLSETLLPFLAEPHLIAIDSGRLIDLLGKIGGDLGLLLVGPVLLLIVAALVANRLQHPMVFS